MLSLLKKRWVENSDGWLCNLDHLLWGLGGRRALEGSLFSMAVMSKGKKVAVMLTVKNLDTEEWVPIVKLASITNSEDNEETVLRRVIAQLRILAKKESVLGNCADALSRYGPIANNP